MPVFLVIGQDDKAIDLDTATDVASLFREPWDIDSLRGAVSRLGPGDQLIVDGSTVIRLSGVEQEFK